MSEWKLRGSPSGSMNSRRRYRPRPTTFCLRADLSCEPPLLLDMSPPNFGHTSPLDFPLALQEMVPRPTTTTKTYDTILLLIQMCIFEGLFAGKRFRLLELPFADHRQTFRTSATAPPPPAAPPPPFRSASSAPFPFLTPPHPTPSTPDFLHQITS